MADNKLIYDIEIKLQKALQDLQQVKSAAKSTGTEVASGFNSATDAVNKHTTSTDKLTKFIKEQKTEERQHRFVINEVRDAISAASLAFTIYSSASGKASKEMKNVSDSLNAGVVAFQGIGAITSFLPGPIGLAAQALGAITTVVLKLSDSESELEEKNRKVAESFASLVSENGLTAVNLAIREADRQMSLLHGNSTNISEDIKEWNGNLDEVVDLQGSMNDSLRVSERLLNTINVTTIAIADATNNTNASFESVALQLGITAEQLRSQNRAHSEALAELRKQQEVLSLKRDGENQYIALLRSTGGELQKLIADNIELKRIEDDKLNTARQIADAHKQREANEKRISELTGSTSTAINNAKEKLHEYIEKQSRLKEGSAEWREQEGAIQAVIAKLKTLGVDLSSIDEAKKKFGEAQANVREYANVVGTATKQLEAARDVQAQYGSEIANLNGIVERGGTLTDEQSERLGYLNTQYASVTKIIKDKENNLTSANTRLLEAKENMSVYSRELNIAEDSVLGLTIALQNYEKEQAKTSPDSPRFKQLQDEIAETQRQLNSLKAPPLSSEGFSLARRIAADVGEGKKEIESFKQSIAKLFVELSPEDKIRIQIEADLSRADEQLRTGLQAELQIINEWEESIVDSHEATEEQKTRASQIAARRRSQAELAEAKKVMSELSSGFRKAFGVISDFSKASSQARIDDVEAQRDSALAAIDAQIAAAEGNEVKQKELLAKRAKLEEEYRKKVGQAKREAWEADKQGKLLQAVIDTASAVVEALPNIPLSILAGVLGAAQIGLIASTAPPKFHQGGSFYVDAPTTTEVPILVRGGERGVIRTEEQQENDTKKTITMNFNFYSPVSNEKMVADAIERRMRELGATDINGVFKNNRAAAFIIG